ncbi:hypothetical protein [Pengzhenrongella sp.]|uniref:hypothetical protein n=1 Tax=Pengzhenrongella sp. TaxID=2888820 RepID=UPI002F947786
MKALPAELAHVPRAYLAYLVVAQSVRYEHAAKTAATAQSRWATVVDFDRAAYARPLVWAARTRKAPITTLVHGTPTPSTYLPVLCDGLMAWGEVQQAFFAEHAPTVGVTVVGRPQIEGLLPTTDAPSRLLLCHSMEDLSDSEVRRLEGVLRTAKSRGIECVLRPHPRDPETGTGAGWLCLRGLVDSVSTASQSLQDEIRPGDLVVSVVSTSAVDALAMGARVFVAADPDRALSCDLEFIRDRSDGPFSELSPGAPPSESASRLRVVAVTGDESRRRVGRALRALVVSAAQR